MKVMMRKFERK